MTWPRKSIAEIAEINPRIPARISLRGDSNIDFVPMASLSTTGCVTPSEIRKTADVLKGYTYFENGDVLVAKITPCMENGKAAFVDGLPHGIGFGSTEFHVLRPSEQVSGEYLFWMVWSPMFRDAAGVNMTGSAGQKRVPAGFFDRYQIPLPPLPEQKRIAAILDAADALRAKRRETIEQLDSLVQATFLEMFGDPARGWAPTTVGHIAANTPSSIRTGPFGSQLLHSEFTDEGVRVLGIDNAVANEFRKGVPRFISPAKHEQLRRYTVSPGDVLITIMGTCGRCAIVPEGIGTAINTKHLCCITLDRQKCLPRFLHAYFLRHPVAHQYLRAQTKGAIMEGLNMGIIKAMPISLPPLDLQTRFASIVESIELQKTRLKAHLTELDALFSSLQSRAFNGELVA
jgi:type I restriction enzyme S subunit